MTEQIDHKKMLEEFYSKPFYLSYSGLNKLLYSPSVFYRHYILQQREDKLESYLIDGKVIHCLLLEDGSFNDKFMLMPSSLPTGNTKLVIDRVWDAHRSEPVEGATLDTYKDKILEILKEINLHQSLTDDKKSPFKTGDEKRLEKIITEAAKTYWEFLQIKGDKDLIDEETLARCNESVSALKENSDICELLGCYVTEMDNVDVFNEKPLTVELDRPFGLKGIVDNFKVDRTKKIVYVNDIKTTSKTISDFKETVEFYNYWIQAAIYYRLVHWFMFLDTGEHWTIVFNFIVVDRYLQVYPFEVSQETMQSWQGKLEEKLNEAEWHYASRNYKLPHAFAVGKVML